MSIFDGIPHSRITDPDTSRESAETTDISRQALRVLWAYTDGEPHLDHEAYKIAGFPSGRTSHQRCSDLRNAGYIVRTGERAKTPYGKNGYLCQITARGYRYYLRRRQQAILAKGIQE
jgi:hypothetical protein